MRLIPDQDERDFAAMLRDLLGAECPTTLVRRLRRMPTERTPPTLWKAPRRSGRARPRRGEEYGGSGGRLIRPRRLLRRGRPGAVPDGRAQHRARGSGDRPLGGRGAEGCVAARALRRDRARRPPRSGVAQRRRRSSHRLCAPDAVRRRLATERHRRFRRRRRRAPTSCRSAATPMAGGGPLVLRRAAARTGTERRATHPDGWIPRLHRARSTMSRHQRAGGRSAVSA